MTPWRVSRARKVFFSRTCHFKQSVQCSIAPSIIIQSDICLYKCLHTYATYAPLKWKWRIQDITVPYKILYNCVIPYNSNNTIQLKHIHTYTHKPYSSSHTHTRVHTHTAAEPLCYISVHRRVARPQAHRGWCLGASPWHSAYSWYCRSRPCTAWGPCPAEHRGGTCHDEMRLQWWGYTMRVQGL